MAEVVNEAPEQRAIEPCTPTEADRLIASIKAKAAARGGKLALPGVIAGLPDPRRPIAAVRRKAEAGAFQRLRVKTAPIKATAAEVAAAESARTGRNRALPQEE